MSELLPDDLDLITITQLRQVANQTPQPYRLHLQVESRIEKATSSGSPFFEVKIVDAADSFIWRVFDNNPLFQDAAKLARNAFIQLAGMWVEGKYGLEPRQVQMRLLAEDETSTLLLGDPDLAARQHADYADIVAFIESMRDPRLLKLCRVFLERYGERFRRTGAARRHHHARRGGLVEHVAQMMRCAVALAGLYPQLNRDLMIAGVLFHDCGKLWENAYAESGFTMPYNLTAEMLGHIPLGLELVNKLWRDLLDDPAAAEWTSLEPASEIVRLHLLHLIAAHHGTHEFGSPVLPKTPEAVALHHVDNIDAKLEMFRRGYASSKELGPGIFEKFPPWPVNIVAPLPAVNLPQTE
ncbi:MAG: HD domain-containing protein [Prosthecobacter sp.]|uniref:HD domain-containing protein n=1 Tax=Prosthecobacter sp. TaxID=1965333 RepID=UPI0025CF8013|nr:HD domain-containing protein [Prosthecobacter sp.]MCF7786987.1 HD domain-containing protein [Prosthecobacter sp.]